MNRSYAARIPSARIIRILVAMFVFIKLHLRIFYKQRNKKSNVKQNLFLSINLCQFIQYSEIGIYSESIRSDSQRFGFIMTFLGHNIFTYGKSWAVMNQNSGLF